MSDSKIFFEIPEAMLKQATLVASRYSDKTILGIIEECFNYGVKSLYTDAPKPVPPERKPIEEYFNGTIENERIEELKESVNYVIDNARQEIEEGGYYTSEELPESYGEAVITSDGLFEL